MPDDDIAPVVGASDHALDVAELLASLVPYSEIKDLRDQNGLPDRFDRRLRLLASLFQCVGLRLLLRRTLLRLSRLLLACLLGLSLRLLLQRRLPRLSRLLLACLLGLSLRLRLLGRTLLWSRRW